jgi:3-oxoacyl-[acyl-carrier-protein] synthase II
MNERRVVISGLGAVTPFGIGIESFWSHIAEGKSAASLITSFDVSLLPTQFAAFVPLTNHELEPFIENQRAIKTMSRLGMFAIIAAQEAFADSGIEKSTLNSYRVGTSIGTSGLGLWDIENVEQTVQVLFDSMKAKDGNKLDQSHIWKNTLDRMHPLAPLKALTNVPTAHVAIQYNARGNCQTISTACTSSAQAIGEAYRQIKFGIADVIIAGGSDSMINPNGLVSFSVLGVLSRNNKEYKTASRPFDRRRDGFMLGEGAGIFILEDYAHCKKRGAVPYAEVAGYASTNDAFRLTDEPPEAWGSIEAMNLSLSDAKINPEEVDYINAHGTGTSLNDKTETFAIKSVFKDKAFSLPVSSTKSMIGHLVAAAGAVELAACILALKHQIIPPTINYQEPDPECDLDYVPINSREAPLNVILSNSFGFGGQNACLVIRKVS